MAEIREWRRQIGDETFVISTKRALLNLDFINEAFTTKDMYWAKKLSVEELTLMLDSSSTLGLYKLLPAVPNAATADEPSSPRTPSPTLESEPEERFEQLGMARFITDHITTAYLTDVFMDPASRSLGLGKWLIDCCKEVLEAMPAFRRAFLMADPGKGADFYAKALDFYDVGVDRDRFLCMTRRGWKTEAEMQKS